MADKSAIEWTEATWNPIVGCTHVSPGCDNCYAARAASGRLRRLPLYAGLAEGGKFTGEVRLVEERLSQPLRWQRPRRVFVNSMSDLFHESVPDGYIARIWDVMGQCSQHTFQILTKRHARMRSWVSRWADTLGESAVPLLRHGPEQTRAAHPSGRGQLFADMLESMGTAPEGYAYPTFDWMEGQRWWPSVLPNVWLGVSVENQKWADIRIPALLETPAVVRWLSCEPLLGPVDISDFVRPVSGCTSINAADGLCAHPDAATPECHRYSDCPVSHRYGGIDWVVVGGESGPDARPMHPDWARNLRDQCAGAGVPFFFKQHGEWLPLGPLYEQYDGDDEAEEARFAAVFAEVDDGKDVVQLERSGYIAEGHQPGDSRTWLMARCGRKTAGRELDGRTHDEYPAVSGG